MASKTFTTSVTASLTSTWTGKEVDSGYGFDTNPTKSTKQLCFHISGIPTNARNIKGSISYSGANSNWKIEQNVPGINTRATLAFCSVSGTWKGSALGIGSQSQTVTLSGLTLTVTWSTGTGTPSADDDEEETETEENRSIERQIQDFTSGGCDATVAIYNPSTKKVYMFDGVVKLGYSFSLSVEDEKKKPDDYEYTNNAKLQASEISAEIVMSDTCSGDSHLTRRSDTNVSRSSAAIRNLYALQNSRKLVRVLTSYMTFKEMLIKSISVTQDDSNQYGWSATITFHERLIVQAPPKGGNNSGSTITDNNRTSSGIALLRFGS